MQPRTAHAMRAYQAAADNRSLKAQEADVFHRATGAMRNALSGNDLDKVRALADNQRLWLTVLGLVQDPDNKLPLPVRVSLVSVGRSVQREMDQPSPDFEFLIGVNENIAAGLSAAM